MNTKKLQMARLNADYTQPTLAKALNISLKTYNLKELGKSEFKASEIKRLIQLLNLSLDQANEIFLK